MILDRILLSALHKAMSSRGDGQPQLMYFSASEYGVKTSPFSFYSGKWKLNGNRYFVNDGPYKALLVFFHGLGGGSSAYTQEICALAKQGFLVYAYDNTGCMTSEGKSIGFLSQSLVDQAAFFAMLESDPLAKGLPRYAVGHSWGGFTALGALNKEYGVSKVDSLAGVTSLKDIIAGQKKSMERMTPWIEKALRRGYGRFGTIDMYGLIRDADARILYVQGEADPLVRKQTNYDVLQRLFADKPNLELMLVPGALHNPYWTLEAQAYFVSLQKKGILNPDYDNSIVVDYAKLNQDDPQVMGKVFDYLLR